MVLDDGGPHCDGEPEYDIADVVDEPDYVGEPDFDGEPDLRFGLPATPVLVSGPVLDSEQQALIHDTVFSVLDGYPVELEVILTGFTIDRDLSGGDLLAEMGRLFGAQVEMFEHDSVWMVHLVTDDSVDDSL